MGSATPIGARTMAKVQKTVMVPEDLYRLVQSFEKQTGASFTRITIAALLQYLFTRPEGPDPLWMEHAVSLELGEVQVGDMSAKRMNDLSADTYGQVGSTEVGPGAKVKEVDSDTRRSWSRWKKIAKHPGDDPLQTIIDFWLTQR